MSLEDLEACAKSFHFDRCVQREGLNKALEAHAEVGSGNDFDRPPNVWLQEQGSGQDELGV